MGSAGSTLARRSAPSSRSLRPRSRPRRPLRRAVPPYRRGHRPRRTGTAPRGNRLGRGVGVGLAPAAAFGPGRYPPAGGLREPSEQLYEGITLVLAASAATSMLLRTRCHAGAVRGELQEAGGRVL